MNSIINRMKKAALSAALAGVLLAVTAAPSRCDGPLVPAPKLPPPSSCTTLTDGTVVYKDGTVVYPSGLIVYPDGTTAQL